MSAKSGYCCEMLLRILERPDWCCRLPSIRSAAVCRNATDAGFTMHPDHQRSKSPTVVNDHLRNCRPFQPSARVRSHDVLTCILLLVLLTSNASATTVWTWVDAKGVTHYSQTPAPGARRVEIAPHNRAVPATPSSSSSTSADPPQATTSAAKQTYTEFTIVRPADDANLWNIGGVVPVSLRLVPTLRPGNGIVFYLDDRRRDDVTPTATEFELKDVSRGTHLLVAVVHDEQRTPLHEAAVTFHVQQTIAKPKPAQPLPNKP